MKSLFLALIIVLANACTSLTPTAGNKMALQNERSNSMNTIIFGRLIDLNPLSVKEKLQMTYTLSKEKTGGMFGTDTAFPNMDPATNYFWVSIPTHDAQYFGIRSIRFKINGTEKEAVLRDEVHNRPLFGISLESTNKAKYIYVGDITIRSGIRKTSSGINLEVFDLKEAYNKPNSASAKSYIEERGFNPEGLVVKPMNLKQI